MNVYFFSAALSLCFFISCTTNESQSARLDSIKTTDSVAQVTDRPEPTRPDDDDLKETGLLKEIDDSGYPFAVLTIEFPERNFSEQFTINLERVKGASMQLLSQSVGQYVQFTYTSVLSNALLDIQEDGKSLLGDDAPTLQADTKQIMGKLSGANRETTGDEPGKITITTDDNTTETFRYFVTKELVAANGKIVIGYFEERTQNTINNIKVLPK